MDEEALLCCWLLVGHWTPSSSTANNPICCRLWRTTFKSGHHPAALRRRNSRWQLHLRPHADDAARQHQPQVFVALHYFLRPAHPDQIPPRPMALESTPGPQTQPPPASHAFVTHASLLTAASLVPMP
jgi:hypothetical protein